jgi:integrase
MERKGWLSIGKRKKGDVYIHHFYRTENGTGRRTETCVTIGPVAKFVSEADVWAEINRGKANGTVGRLTVSDLAKKYLETDVPLLAHSTQELIKHELNNYILPRWGKTYVDEVRPLEVKQWLIHTAEQNDLTKASIQKTKQIFARLYFWGAENELIASSLNPVTKVPIEKIGKKSTFKAIVVPRDIAQLIADSLPLIHKTLVYLAAGTGMRVSEMLALKWADIDFDRKIINLRRTWVYGREGEGKTEESRKPVYIGGKLAVILRAWHFETAYGKPGDWVFASAKLSGKRPISGSQFVKDYIRPAFIQHGLIDAEYTGRAGLHAFRHSLATILITEEGVDPKTAQGMLRHATAGITMDIYTHAAESAMRAAQEKYEAGMAN